MSKKRLLVYLSIVFITISCKDLYTPDILELGDTYLVVEGVLNAGPESSSVRLSRTAKLYTLDFDPVLNATVTVEGKDNSIAYMSSSGNGYYNSPGLGLVINNEYRLRIKTFDGKEYLSEYVLARNTPSIDSIGWRQNSEGVRLYVNTHDASESTHYYRWDYDETWEIRSHYYSQWIYIPPTTVRERVIPAEEVYYCWKYNSSSSIFIGSSAKLQSDVIFESPLAYIPTNHEKLSVRYSILVRQYALDKEGYEFYELMKKNTEQIGTVFDPQPSEIRGNIRCVTNPSEPVIGYITASTITQKRIFIEFVELNDWRFIQTCMGEIVRNNPDSIRDAYQNRNLSPYAAEYDFFGNISGYWSSYKQCVECTARGGNTSRPPYW